MFIKTPPLKSGYREGKYYLRPEDIPENQRRAIAEARRAAGTGVTISLGKTPEEELEERRGFRQEYLRRRMEERGA